MFGDERMSSQSIAVKPSVGLLGRGGFLDKYFYFGMSLLVAVVVVYGFSHTVDHDLIDAAPPRPWILWVHGAVFSGWVLFFILQSSLVRTRNVKIHRTLGWFGAGMAGLMTVLGISTAIVMDHFNFYVLHQAGEKIFFAIQALDMVSFTTLFWLAVYWRKKPEFHRRLILMATCVLLAAAFGRFPGVGAGWAYFGVDGMIFLGVVRDLIVNRKVHAVYRYALPPLIVWQIFMVQVWVHHPAWWVRVTNAIIG
jgi:hypothetical protein